MKALGFAALAFVWLAACSSNAGSEQAEAIATATPDLGALRAATVRAIYFRAGMTQASTRGFEDAIALANYVRDPAGGAGAFVRGYPTGGDGVNDDFGSTLDAARLVRGGERFPVDALLALAKSDPQARSKLLEAMTVAAGSRVALYDRAADAMLVGLPAATALTTLGRLPEPARILAPEEIDWCAHRPSAILESARASIAGSPVASGMARNEHPIVDQIARAVARCPKPLHPATRHPKRRRRRPTRPDGRARNVHRR